LTSLDQPITEDFQFHGRYQDPFRTTLPPQCFASIILEASGIAKLQDRQGSRSHGADRGHLAEAIGGL
jgi:hypothetical protein